MQHAESSLHHKVPFAVACRLSCSVACGIFVPQSGLRPAFPTLHGGFLILGKPVKAPSYSFVTACSTEAMFLFVDH